MIGANQLAFYALAGGAVYDVPEHLTVTIHDAVFTREVLVFRMNMEGVWLLLRAAQLAPQVLAIHAEPELVCVRCVVPEPVVDIVVRDAGTRAERNLTAKIGKEVQPVVVVMLGDGQLAVQYKPVNQVRQLAAPASYAFRRLSFCNSQSLFIALPFSGPANKVPYRERLAGTVYQTVNTTDCQGRIGGLVFLQLHVYVAQPAAYQRVVLIDCDG